MSRRHCAVEGVANGLDGVGKVAVERKDDVMFAAIAHDRLGQRRGIPADAARARGGRLHALHIDDDAHQRLALRLAIAALSSA